jgi:tellurite resistance protein
VSELDLEKSRKSVVMAHPVVRSAIDTLIERFEQGDYNPTPIIDLGVLVANADGAPDEEEIETLLQIFQTLLGASLSKAMVGYLIDASLEVAKAAGTESRVRLIAEILNDCDAVEPGIIVALAVAYSSEGLSTAERGVIDAVARAAGLSTNLLDALVESVRASLAASTPAPSSERAKQPARS